MFWYVNIGGSTIRSLVTGVLSVVSQIYLFKQMTSYELRISDWSSDVCSSDLPDDLSIEAYVKNVFNSTPITDAFLNSDDSGLTTNVFTLDPRIIGFSIAKKF